MTALEIRGGSWWLEHAAAVVARYPLAASDWEQHADAVDTGFYSVQIRTGTPAPAAVSNCDFADEPPLSPEDEETLF